MRCRCYRLDMNVLKKSSQKFSNLQYLCLFISSKQSVSYLGKWEQPQGYDTGITVYNSAASRKVPLILKKKNLASWYMCGPTVYADSHIGHASCYVKFDIIRRILENVFHIKVLLLLGITDIDDKIIKKSNEIGINSSQLAKKYESDFFEDMEAMRVLPPTAISRVSQNIPLIISFCEKLIENGFAYFTSEGNVYFMVSKGITSDVLNELPDETLQKVQNDPLKKDPRDFALWKASKRNEPFWDSPWGKGRPGWHIECSAMASKMFGSNVDLHSGGYDLLFPHHSNEISQSQAYHGCTQWVNYWLHTGLLKIDHELKMSKSLGNTVSIKDFLKEHYVNDFRIFCLQSLYRKNLFYNSETLSGAKSLHKKIHNFINDCELHISGENKGPITQEDKLLLKLSVTKEQIISHLGNDFNTSQALLCLTDFIDEVNKCLPVTDTHVCENSNSVSTIAKSYFYVTEVLEMLGVHLVSKKKLSKEIVFAVDSIVEFRNKIRSVAANPKIIGEGETLTIYIDKMYKCLEIELKIIHESNVHQKFITDLSQDCTAFYSKTRQFSEVSQKTLRLFDEIKPKEAKKMMSPLFAICDEFRLILHQKGIGIKDRGNKSSWIPLIELQKNLPNSI